ncbi:hypothetical protein FM106_18295 [Brachybacterium faecium]|nr:hypothetical protein FM106_18295 [Brachybacterium faecium]
MNKVCPCLTKYNVVIFLTPLSHIYDKYSLKYRGIQWI